MIMKSELPLAQRRSMADRIRERRLDVARAVTEAFLERHPDWLERYGDRAWVRGREDAVFHLDFLAAAVQGGSTEAFQDYASWTAGVLSSRGIASDFLVENLETVALELGRILKAEDSEFVSGMVGDAIAAVRTAGAASMAGKGGAGDGSTAPADLHGAPGAAAGVEQRMFLQSILAGNRTAALNVALEALRMGRSVSDVYCDVLQPAQYEVGRLWERNQITVAREHAATAVTQFVVAQLYTRMTPPPARRGNALVTGVEGELHQLGANMISDVLEADGWNVRFLGTQLPHADILDSIHQHEPRLVGISTTMLFNLPRVSNLVEGVRKQFGSEVHVVVGGGAYRNSPNMWREIGADGYGHDLRSGLTTAQQLLPPR
jgi:MerR family transcriptional regulator, light-induced transcriptional regulator